MRNATMILLLLVRAQLGCSTLPGFEDPTTDCENIYDAAMEIPRSMHPEVSLRDENGVFLKTGPRTLLLHVGKTGGTTAAATLTANKVPFQQLHVNPVDVDMIRYFDDIIISTRDPVQRFVSALNNMLPGGEVPYRNPVFIQCFPNVSVAADVIFDDTECGAMLRRGPSHLGIGYCFYMGGKAAREALKYHRPRVHLVQQESFDADMESVLRVVGKKVPPFVVPKSVHTKTHLSKEMSSSGAAKLRAWLELIGEYDLYRELKALQA